MLGSFPSELNFSGNWSVGFISGFSKYEKINIGSNKSTIKVAIFLCIKRDYKCLDSLRILRRQV